MLDLPDTKPAFERAFRPVARHAHRLGITANGVTITSATILLAAGALAVDYPAALWPLAAIVAAMLVRLALNHINGLQAREHGMKTSLGMILNETATPIEDAALYLPLAMRAEMPGRMIVAAVILGTFVEMAGLCARAIGGFRRHDGPLTKVVRGAFFGVRVVAIALGLARGQWVGMAFAALLARLIVTALNRLNRALKEAHP